MERILIPHGEAPQNDWDDFKMPWRIYGKLSLEMMKVKFQSLDNYSKGNYLRYTGHFNNTP